jgi:hypothetical protein
MALKNPLDYIKGTQIYKSVFRHGMPENVRNRALVVLSNVFLHLHPTRVRTSGIRLKYTWCMGGAARRTSRAGSSPGAR